MSNQMGFPITPQTSKLNPNPTRPLISKVRVVVRVRPFLPNEIDEKRGHPISCVSVLDPEIESQEEVTVRLKDLQTSRNECYKLDSFFGEEDNNVGQIFLKEVNPLIPEIFRGFNATVFVYGATGSGKTYTMQGSNFWQRSSE
ncbi:Kinesin motor domain [Dillenia turbinata]|uniref:Kinesin motor domain n=1 Tax=Dillenia turbinata TaxID=194707 RepID=A0AAN8YTJ6_9MAGN